MPSGGFPEANLVIAYCLRNNDPPYPYATVCLVDKKAAKNSGLFSRY